MPFAEKKMEKASKRGDKSFYGKRESACAKVLFLKPNSKKALCAENHLPQELLLQEEFPAQGILCQRNRTFPSRCSWNAAIYWVGFTFRNPPGTQPTARSEVYLSCGSNQLAAMQLSAQLSHTATLTRGQAVPGPPLQAGVAGGGLGGHTAGPPSSSISSTTRSHRCFSKGGSWISQRRCSGTPCRSWHTQCPGPGGRCWGSAGSKPPTEAPDPSPGRPCHQVLLRFSTSMGASAAQ